MILSLADVSPGAKVTVIAIAALVFALAACDEGGSPTAPDIRPATITIENVATTATAPPCCARGPFTYWMWLTLRESAGVGATISQITATLIQISGATTVAQLYPLDAFGTTRIPANGMLASTSISSAGPLLTVSEMTVRVTFTDHNGNTGSAQTSTAVRLDVTGDWIGPLQIRTQPPGDWSLARMSLVQSGDSLIGELVSRDGVRFPLSGSVSVDWAPYLSIRGMPTHSSGCAVTLVVTQFEFMSGQVWRLSGHATGRCPGTVAGTFELQRSS